MPLRKTSSAKRHHEEMMAKYRMPRLDRGRYTPLEGMEGPFQFKGGEILYYDPSVGRYYNRDSDMYLSDRDADRITSRTAQHKFAGSGLKAVQALLSVGKRKANHLLHALSALIVEGNVRKMDLEKIKGEIEIEQSSMHHPSSPSHPDNDFIEGTDALKIKLSIEVAIDELEKLSDVQIRFLNNDKRAMRDLCDALTKNINGNILRNMKDEQLDLAFGDVQHEVEYDIPQYYIPTHIEIIEHDYKVVGLEIERGRHIIAHVAVYVKYGIFVEFDKDSWEADKY